MRVMQQSIEQCGDGRGIAGQLPPIADGPI
jgi:hypothetical protein